MSLQVTPLTGSIGADVKGIDLNKPMRKASMTIQVAPLTGSIGAEVKGINLSKPIDDALSMNSTKRSSTTACWSFAIRTWAGSTDRLRQALGRAGTAEPAAQGPGRLSRDHTGHQDPQGDGLDRGVALRLALYPGAAEDLDPRRRDRAPRRRHHVVQSVSSLRAALRR